MGNFENIKAFENAMNESAELREKFEAAEERIYKNKEAANIGDLLSKAAFEVGFNLSASEIEQAFAQSRELSDDDLSNVSGGNDLEYYKSQKVTFSIPSAYEEFTKETRTSGGFYSLAERSYLLAPARFQTHHQR